MNQDKKAQLEELFKQASQIAQKVPENMQEAAFNRALDMLAAGSDFTDTAKPRGDEMSGTFNIKEDACGENNLYPQPAQDLSTLDPMKYPGITALSKVLDRSLLILHIARREYGIDGLTPATIAEILTEKFYINTKSTAICNALDLTPSLARRVSDGTRFIYKIRLAGEEHLSNLEHEKRE